MDVVVCFGRVKGVLEPTVYPGGAEPFAKGFEAAEAEFADKNPGAAATVCWYIRCDSVEHAKASWGQAMKNPGVAPHMGANPLGIAKYVKMESRFMEAAFIPRRFGYDTKKVYEVRHYRLSDDFHDKKEAYVDWLVTHFNDGALKDFKCVAFFVEKKDAPVITVSGTEMTGGAAYPGDNCPPATVTWVAEWDSKEAGEAAYASADMATVLEGNPFSQHKEGKPMNGYGRVEREWCIPTFLPVCD